MIRSCKVSYVIPEGEIESAKGEPYVEVVAGQQQQEQRLASVLARGSQARSAELLCIVDVVRYRD